MKPRTKALLSVLIVLAVALVALVVYLQRQADRTRPRRPLITEVKPVPSPTTTPQFEIPAEPSVTPSVTKSVTKSAIKAAATVPVIPQPWKPGEMPRMYAGELVPIGAGKTYKVPTGLMVNLLTNAESAPNRLEYPVCWAELTSGCQRDWVQPNGSILRAYFTACTKQVVVNGQPNFALDSTCVAQKAHDAATFAQR